MDPNNLSPEAILKQKELSGGISYDDQIADLAPANIIEDKLDKELESLKSRKEEMATPSPLLNEIKNQTVESETKEPPSVMSIG